MKTKLCGTKDVTAQNFRIQRIIFLMMNKVEIANNGEAVTPVSCRCGVKLYELVKGQSDDDVRKLDVEVKGQIKGSEGGVTWASVQAGYWARRPS